MTGGPNDHIHLTFIGIFFFIYVEYQKFPLNKSGPPFLSKSDQLPNYM